MEKIKLGASDLEVTQLCYGCMRISGWWEPERVTAENIENGIKAVEQAYESGINFYDHADIYCAHKCEEIFGIALKRHKGWREQMVIATKCGIRFDNPHRFDFSKDHILASADRSLKALGIDTIDLYQLHRPDYLCNPFEVAEAFSVLHKAGKVRWFGVSNFFPSTVSMLQKHLPLPIVSNQVEIHLLNQERLNDGTLDQCLEMGITPLAYSPVAGGKIADGFDPGNNMALRGLHGVMDEIAARHGISRSGVAQAWLMLHPSKIIPIIGTARPERIAESAKDAAKAISREDWYRLMVAARGQKLP